MKNRISFVFIFFLCFFISPDISGLALEELLNPDQIRDLLAGEKPVVAQFSNIWPRLAPWHGQLRELLTVTHQALNPSVMVEALYVYKKPSEADKTTWTAAEEAGIYNSILALSTLTGTQYYSATRGVMRTFYEMSSVIDGPSTKRQIPDPAYSRPPAKLTVYARHKDTTFGDNVYQYDFYSAPGAFIFTQINLTTFYYGIIPVVGKENLRSTVAIFDAENYILVYVASMAKAASVPGMKDRMGNSFANRAEAICKWFTEQADKAYRKVYL
jgi:hypothetical protein